MKRLQLWILAAALGSFAAGMNVGLAAPSSLAATDAADDSADDAYVHAMVSDYDLSRAQQAGLRMVLQSCRQAEMAAFRTAEIEMLPESIQRALLQARDLCERRIQAILDDGQRARYELATRPQSRRDK